MRERVSRGSGGLPGCCPDLQGWFLESKECCPECGVDAVCSDVKIDHLKKLDPCLFRLVCAFCYLYTVLYCRYTGRSLVLHLP